MIDEKANLEIKSLEELSEKITQLADIAIQIAADRSGSSNYYVGYEHFSDLISKEDYDRYFDFIADEVESREEVLDLERDGKELNMIIGTDWCKSYAPSISEELSGQKFGWRDVTPGISMVEKARRYDITETLQKRTLEGPLSHDADTFPTENVPGVEGLTIYSNIYGQPLFGSSWDEPWLYAAEQKFLGTHRWSDPPQGFHALLGAFHGSPVVVYSRALTQDDTAHLDRTTDFINTVVDMTAAFLRRRHVTADHIRFYSSPANREGTSAELLVLLPATMDGQALSTAIAYLNNVLSDKHLPINDLKWSHKQFESAKAFYAEKLSSGDDAYLKQFPNIPPIWFQQSIPEMASDLCWLLANYQNRPDDPDAILDPERFLAFSSIDRPFMDACYQLMKPVLIKTYTHPMDAKLEDGKERSIVEHKVPYGALRAALINDAKDGEPPLSVEDFTQGFCSYEYAEDILRTCEDMLQKPSLDIQLKNADSRKSGEPFDSPRHTSHSIKKEL